MLQSDPRPAEAPLPELTVRSLTGSQLHAAVPDLAALRIAVFAEWPYLYAGSAAYEEAYLREFLASSNAVLVAAFAGSRIVGAATASPLSAQKPELRNPFVQRGIDPAGLFYFGESVLLPAYRGRGLGHAFFDHREAQARAFGAEAATFAAVVRPADHPARPAGYTPLDRFWSGRGYAPVDGLVTTLAWQDNDETGETPKPMQYWMRLL